MTQERIFKILLSSMEYVDGQNNYEHNTMFITIYDGYFEVETACTNDYGSVWGNDNKQVISFCDVKCALDELIDMIDYLYEHVDSTTGHITLYR